MGHNNATAFRASSKATRNAQRPLRLVVADDDLDTVLTLMMVLRDEGHEVRGVHTADEVLKVVSEFQPDASASPAGRC